MTFHPAAGCTPRECAVFEQIADGRDLGHPQEITDALYRRALIGRYGESYSNDGGALAATYRYYPQTWAKEQLDQWRAEATSSARGDQQPAGKGGRSTRA